MSHIIRKPAFAYAKIKDADQATAQLISDFVFAVYTIPLLFNMCQAVQSGLCRIITVGNHEDRFSHDAGHIKQRNM